MQYSKVQLSAVKYRNVSIIIPYSSVTINTNYWLQVFALGQVAFVGLGVWIMLYSMHWTVLYSMHWTVLLYCASLQYSAACSTVHIQCTIKYRVQHSAVSSTVQYTFSTVQCTVECGRVSGNSGGHDIDITGQAKIHFKIHYRAKIHFFPSPKNS